MTKRDTVLFLKYDIIILVIATKFDNIQMLVRKRLVKVCNSILKSIGKGE